MSEPPDSDTETFERIPWSHLMDVHREGRNRSLLTIGGVVAAVAAAFVVAGMVGSGGSAPTVATLAQPATSVTGAVATTAAPPVTAATIPLLSEADLMAAVTPDTNMIAGTAEWFVTDYFTVDAGGSSASFIQWARAFEVTPVDDRYDVTVLFGALGAGADGRYSRLPVRAVVVTMELRDGVWVPGHVPHAVAIPASFTTPQMPAPAVEILPETVRRRALEHAADWPVATVRGGTQTDQGWSILVDVADEQGTTWALRVTVDG